MKKLFTKLSKRKISKSISVIVWMALIFLFSNESATTSSSRSSLIIAIFNPAHLNISDDLLTFIVRKAAHMFLFFILGILIFNLLTEFKLKKRKLIGLSVLFTFIYALFDELHQLLIPGRSGEIRDIGIDLLGSLIGISLCAAFIRFKTSHKIYKNRLINYLKKTKLSILANSILSVAMALSYLLAVYAVITTNLLPFKYLVFIIPISLVTVLWLALKNHQNTFKPMPKSIFLIVANLVIMLFSLYIYSGVIEITTFLDSVHQKGYSYIEYSIIAKKDSNVSLIQNNNSIGLLKNDENFKLALSEVKSRTNTSQVYYDEIISLTAAMDSYGLDSAALPSSRLLLLKENYNEFYSSIKVIDTFRIKVKNGSVNQDIDITKPFIVYISGIDTYGQISTVSRSDVNIIMVINPKTYKILLVTTPRDFYVQLHGTTGVKDKLTHAGIYGIDMSVRTLQDFYGINIDHYVRVNFTTVLSIIDKIGGVDVYSDNYFNSGGYTFNIGINHLNANQALEFSRNRYAFSAGDRTRGQNQQKVIEAIISKANNASNLLKFNSLLKSISGGFQTDASQKEISSLLNQQMNTLGQWKTESISVTGADSHQPTYSMGSIVLYVMEPDLESVNQAKKRISEYLQ